MPPPAEPDHRPGLTVLAGFSPDATDATVDALHRTDPALLAIRHDLGRVRDGIVRRRVLTGDEVLEDVVIELAHGCVSCTLREDVLPTIARLARARPHANQVLVLPPAVEPEGVAMACAVTTVDGRPMHQWVRIDTFSTVADARTFLDDLDSTDDLADRGLAAAEDDTRSVAEVLARQVEFADTIVVTPDPDTGAYEHGRLTALLRSLAPWAEVGTRPGPAHRHDPLTPPVLQRGLEGLPVHRAAETGYGVGSTIYHARRPFHPGRLDAALGSIVDASQRGRGHLWIASQPDTVVAWECTGAGLSMGPAGRWLAALPDDVWDEVTPGRRTTASLLWDPYYGDRNTELVFTGLGLDASGLHALLDRCLLTDEELAGGADGWRALPDPFQGCFALAGAEALTAPVEGDSP